ncbi:MAG: peptidylprolyl isomerase, partial [Rhodothermales bacterium]|nr:peptidylprolyl isomerase [Rhodothermales bacterium]
MILRLSTFLLVTLATFTTDVWAQQEKVVDEIVAIVDDDILLRSDVNGLIFNLLQQQNIPFEEGMFEEALQNLVSQKVLAAHARRDTNLAIPDEEADLLLQQRIDDMARQVGGQAQLEQAYGKTMLELKRDLRNDFEDQLYAERFQQTKLAKIRITPAEVEDWFAQIPSDSLPEVPEAVRMSHIVKFAEPTEAAREDARFILTTIRDSIVTGGGEFEALARAFSNDPGSAENGGRYAGTRISVFVPQFAAVASRIPIGEVSDIFETEFGLHILRVNDRRGDVVDLNQILVAFDIDKFDATNALEELALLRDSVITHEASFAKLAREHSAEESTAADGGRVSDPRTGEKNLMLEGLGPLWRSSLIPLD